MVILTEIQYHPPVAYFVQAAQAEELLLERHEHYVKQTFRNRCHILTSQGPLALTVPVVKGNRKTLITELEIDYGQKWLENHWRTIRSAYGSSPFYAYYADYLRDIYDQKPKLLFDLNLRFFVLYLKWLGLKQPLRFTEVYTPESSYGVVDLRNSIHPKTHADNLHVKPYNQVFGSKFATGMSILDLLFTQGPEAQLYLRQGPKGS